MDIDYEKTVLFLLAWNVFYCLCVGTRFNNLQNRIEKLEKDSK